MLWHRPRVEDFEVVAEMAFAVRRGDEDEPHAFKESVFNLALHGVVHVEEDLELLRALVRRN